MIQFRTVLLIQLHYEFSSRDIPGCQEFFLCDTCIQLTVRAAYALQDRVLTAAPFFFFFVLCDIQILQISIITRNCIKETVYIQKTAVIRCHVTHINGFYTGLSCVLLEVSAATG